jgi:hypothetical protein
LTGLIEDRHVPGTKLGKDLLSQLLFFRLHLSCILFSWQTAIQ